MRQIFPIAVSLVVVALSAAPVVAQVVPPPPEPLLAPLVLRSTAMAGTDCLQPTNASMVQGAAIVRATCAPVPEQIWILIPVNNGTFHLMNGLSGLCLDARGAAASGTPVQQWTCNQISNEIWELNGPAFTVSFTSKVSGSSKYCLDVNDNGPSAQIYGCNGTPSQLWKINPPDTVFVPQLASPNPLNDPSNTAYEYGFVPEVYTAPPGDCVSKNTGAVGAQDPQPQTPEAAKGLNGNKPTVRIYVCP